MKRVILSLALTLPLALGAETFNYGFCPDEAPAEQLNAHGSGKNNDLTALIRLSPESMPQVAAMKGMQITGIRAMMRNDIERKSSIVAYSGTPESTPIATRDCWLFEGWNTVKFSEPITIGDEDIYLGYRANETQGSGHHPVMAYNTPAPSETYYINIDLTGWQEMNSKGSVMIQAIIEGDPKVLETPAATATVFGQPQLIAPESPFEASLSVKNLSSEPISSLTVDYGHGSIDLTEEIAPFANATIPVELRTAALEATDVPFVTTVTKINGKEVTPAYASTTHLYVTRDVFTRIPLIEEFTGLTCVNCPFMAYYLEDARVDYNKPHTYVAHHSGFQKDQLTQPVDEALLFLFGDPANQANPAVMYDRSVLPGETEIIFKASEPSVEPYLSKILAAELVPALAEVNVSIEGNEVTVSGKVSTGSKTADGKVMLSAYLVEDDIIPTMDYLPQVGINFNVNPEAPDDLVSKFRHNGVIRANLTETSTGDPLQFDSEGLYSAKFTLPEFGEKWNKDNCHVVALIHRFDPENRTDNYVLNSGDSKPFVPHESGISDVKAGAKGTLRAVRALDGSIVLLTPVTSAEAYTIAGARIDMTRPQPAGVYIIRATLPDGSSASTKINL